MRRLAAVVVMVLFASLNAIDGVCCPDGCTHEQGSASRPASPQPLDGLCVLCLGGITDPVAADVSAGASLTAEIARLRNAHPADVPSDPPDHPPRS